MENTKENAKQFDVSKIHQIQESYKKHSIELSEIEDISEVVAKMLISQYGLEGALSIKETFIFDTALDENVRNWYEHKMDSPFWNLWDFASRGKDNYLMEEEEYLKEILELYNKCIHQYFN